LAVHKIEVVVQHDRLSDVSEALRRAKIGPFQASEVRLFDPTEKPSGSCRGASYTLGRERVKVELVVAEHEVETAVDAIHRGIGSTGEGDTRLIVLAVEGSLLGRL
jgi:nitrogen regulatory protein P-II 1